MIIPDCIKEAKAGDILYNKEIKIIKQRYENK